MKTTELVYCQWDVLGPVRSMHLLIETRGAFRAPFLLSGQVSPVARFVMFMLVCQSVNSSS